MRLVLTVIIVVLNMASVNVTADDARQVRETEQMLEQVISLRPKYQHVLHFAENYRGWKRSPEFKRLEEFISKNWEAVLRNVEETVSTETQLFILFTAFQSLPQEDYFICLNRLADLCLSGVMRKEVFEWIRVSYEIQTKNAISLNYQNPIVIEIIQKAKIIFADDPYRVLLYDGILSGESKKNIEDSLGDIPETLVQSFHQTQRATNPVDVIEDAGLRIVAAARSQIGRTVAYDPGYAPLDYPMGDIPIERGVCTDVVVRALRDALGMDLQQLVHEDMKAAFLFYPKRRGIRLPDRNIDHRRVAMLMKYFERKGFSVGVSDRQDDYLPGDIVTWGTMHVMIVSDRKSGQGIPLIIHNIGGGTREEDGLFLSDITGHYRITHKGRQSMLNNSIVFIVGLAIVCTVIIRCYFGKRQRVRK